MFWNLFIFVCLISSDVIICDECFDELIELDANCKTVAQALSPNVAFKDACKHQFCLTCPWSHTCDLSCGICYKKRSKSFPPDSSLPPWWVCEVGELLDCTGKCHSSMACSLRTIGYSTCLHWFGDGYCDNGCGSEESCGRKTDYGHTMAFNCPLYDCDGHDCEVCGQNPPFVPPNARIPKEILPMVTTSRDEDMDQLSHGMLWPGPMNSEQPFFSQCRDMTLWKHGETVTCPQLLQSGNATCDNDFCDNCSTAGACDLSCGYCSQNESFWGSTSTQQDLNLQCQSHLSPSSRGFGPRTDKTVSEESVRSPMSWAIVLTTTVSPLQGVSHTKRASPLLRMRDYSKTIYKWASNKASTSSTLPPWPMVVIESSGINLTLLKQAARQGHEDALQDGRQPRTIEFVSFQQNLNVLGDMKLGKGVAEYASIAYALSNSVVVKTASHVVKVTGRYFIHNLDSELYRFSQSKQFIAEDKDEANKYGIKQLVEIDGFSVPLVITQSTPSPWTLFDGVLRSEVVGFVKGIHEWLFEGQNEAIGKPMERILFEKCRGLNQTFGNHSSAVVQFAPLAIDPTRNAENHVAVGL